MDCSPEKSSKSFKEKFLKNSSSLFVQVRPTKRCAETFFEINGSRDI